MIPNVLSIAGTDPTGGAGIQADLKTVAALGGYGMAAITALVAQNTRGVRSVSVVPAEFVGAQLDAVFDDVRVDAVKIGMLSTTEVVRAVVAAVDRWQPPNVVLDPVMVAASGDRLLAAEAVRALRAELLPRADLITPNLPEAADLLDDRPATDLDGMRAQAQRLRRLGPRVLLKGGHLSGPDSPDVLVGETTEEFHGARIVSDNTHGTGCTLSAAIATLRASGRDWSAAVAEAKTYLSGAIAAAQRLDVGTGHGPVHHSYRTVPR